MIVSKLLVFFNNLRAFAYHILFNGNNFFELSLQTRDVISRSDIVDIISRVVHRILTTQEITIKRFITIYVVISGYISDSAVREVLKRSSKKMCTYLYTSINILI